MENIRDTFLESRMMMIAERMPFLENQDIDFLADTISEAIELGKTLMASDIVEMVNRKSTAGYIMD